MVKVTRHRKRPDFAEILNELVDVHFPAAERITLVCDNLNIHKPSVLYSRYDPATAGLIRQKLQWVHTPKHASWLNVAEIENSILFRQCLRRRIPDTDTLVRETAAWCRRRNQHAAPVQWHFTTADAQIKLRKLYPTM